MCKSAHRECAGKVSDSSRRPGHSDSACWHTLRRQHAVSKLCPARMWLKARTRVSCISVLGRVRSQSYRRSTRSVTTHLTIPDANASDRLLTAAIASRGFAVREMVAQSEHYLPQIHGIERQISCLLIDIATTMQHMPASPTRIPLSSSPIVPTRREIHRTFLLVQPP